MYRHVVRYGEYSINDDSHYNWKKRKMEEKHFWQLFY